ncbi:class I SAM-dependent methyltransferase [Bradyrhizobium sp. CB3481]|uniref:class I SAM-dependent methyltransferase n=1 Tax=Bradyrhizobium sp. CB3481 TaxID=3039158 RepID=UPI0024B15E8D|nr:class I SAM-dependent methyltransferase [Bradyrhizobium sp. CB3481]WFU18961.1 methyltransferase domain-containing protein [Bradyrhizobium sp. CB3481]
MPLTLEDYQGGNYERLQRRVSRSNRFPLKPLAIMAGLLNCTVLTIIAIVVWLGGKARPAPWHRELGELYFHVPEMAVHKGIELDALAGHRSCLLGRGIDIGCGNGYIGGLLKRMVGLAELHGVDPVGSFANDTLANGYTGFSCATASEIPLPPASFDCAISICVLEHVRDLDSAFREMLRLLKPGGALVFTTPSPEFRSSTLDTRLWACLGDRTRAEDAARSRDKVSMHFHYATANEWRMNLERIGFDSVNVLPIFSRRQLLVYELMNWSVRVPELYFPDKLWSLCQKIKPMKMMFAWSTAVIAAWVGRWRIGEGCQTHWLISARRPTITIFDRTQVVAHAPS